MPESTAPGRMTETRTRADVSAVYVNYNTIELLRQSIRSLREVAGREGHRVEVIVVDNASREQEREALRAAGDISLVEMERNAGFGAACNAGAEHASAPLLWFTNTDTLFDHRFSIKQVMEHFASHRRCGAASPLLVHADGSVQESQVAPDLTVGWAVREGIGRSLRRGRHGDVRQRLDALSRPGGHVDVAVAAALFVRANAFQAIGGFDEAFFMYLEDSDLCRRLRAAGWTVDWPVGGAATHLSGGSTNQSRRSALYDAAAVLYIRKWQGRSAALAYRWIKAGYRTVENLRRRPA
jgi:GT2 family glycosyltransferase